MNPPLIRTVPYLLALAMACVPCPGLAAPPARDPARAPICTLSRDQIVVAAVPDGQGGAIVAWLDGRGDVDRIIFAQHVRKDLTLDPAWPVDGLAPAPATFGQAHVTMIGDGAGGAIIAWQEGGAPYGSSCVVKAHHLRPDGTLDPRWPVGGRTLAASEGDQVEPALVGDGKGGAIVGWLDRRQLSFEVYAQHLLADGTLDSTWPPGGRAVRGSPPQISLAAVTDAAGGALLVWSEHVPYGQNQFVAQHVLADGTLDPRWPALGRPLSSSTGTQQYALSIIPDGAHGAMAAWAHATYDRQHVVVQHVPEDGSVDPAWSDTGRVASHGPENQYGPILCGDERGGVYVAWGETPYTQLSRRLAHLSATGEIDPEWPSGGLLLGTPLGGGAVASLLPDGKGGTLATGFDHHADAKQSVFAQHVKASGRFDPAWPTGGQELIAPASIVALRVIVPDGEGGELAAWSERGVPAQGLDAFATAVRANGRPVRPGAVDKTAADAALLADEASSQTSPRLALALTSGNPVSRGSATVLHYSLPRAARARLDVYDVAGRLVATVFDGALPAGAGEFRWDGHDATGRTVGAGLYFYRLTSDGDHLTEREIRF